jgi:hypothetical protein
MVVFSSLAHSADKQAAVYTVPIRVHLITGTEFKEGGKKIDLWLTAADFNKSVLPEMNRIWKPAGVQWKVESVVVEPAKKAPDFQQTIASIVNCDKVDMKSLQSFFPSQSQLPNHINLYLMPRIGAENGVAGLGGKVAVVGIWRKPGGTLQRAPLVTCQPPLVSVAKTCAHELGHNLGLKHPDPQLRNRLMIAGPGLELTPEEIDTARKRVAILAK